MRIRVAHLYPDYLNIYADRGNIAVFERRAGLRGHDLEVTAVAPGDAFAPAAFDLIYVGGGQDREQALIAPDLAARGAGLRDAVADGTALLAVCGGYQLLGRGYRGRDGSWMPGAGLFPLETVAGEKRLIGDVLLDVDLDGTLTTVAGFENHAGRTLLDPDADPARSRRRRAWERRHDGFRGLPGRSRDRHVPARPASSTKPCPRGLASLRARSSTRGRMATLEPLDDELERLAHAVSAGRARSRGGR